MPFQPGQSGNPKGRSPRKVEDAQLSVICEIFDADAERLATMAIVEKAAGGDVPAWLALMDRKYGKATQPIAQSGDLNILVSYADPDPSDPAETPSRPAPDSAGGPAL